nr:hypothetical protein [Tanacetum cinerariifolium]
MDPSSWNSALSSCFCRLTITYVVDVNAYGVMSSVQIFITLSDPHRYGCHNTRPNGEALRKCILSGPYKPTTVLVHAVEATDNSPAVAEHTTLETPTNMSPENKAHFLAEKEVIHLILTGIGDDIYSTVDACQTAQEMWESIV